MKKKTRINPFASSSNKEKQKHKNFMMMRYSHSVRTKNKRSFREKQVILHVANRWGSLSSKLRMQLSAVYPVLEVVAVFLNLMAGKVCGLGGFP